MTEFLGLNHLTGFATQCQLMELLTLFNVKGLAIGVVTFLIIGLFHPVVIKAEYYFGVGCWWVFLIFGIATIAVSLCVNSILLSAILAVFGVTCFWSIKELFEQGERVRKGWFPENPKRKKNTTHKS